LERESGDARMIWDGTSLTINSKRQKKDLSGGRNAVKAQDIVIGFPACS
jgi:hypothetical protein